ncbi:putative glycolipid-binding domain-containing protein [Mesorhizobium sp. B2-3-11]|uniref:putative glycolipid-binding domain-containing protein n=1 Tax=Mesorhizobium sp. B2-3-11 TaxID=2589953 RepID=UPI001FEEF8A3|nr:putative glycolipid-binding domain-containing protein [Mesorhizobium sp. B2-3-11]
MTATPVSILWRRLDLEGHDGCLLSRTDSRHSLEGQAIFIQDDKPCCLAYRVDCDTGWRTQSARVNGFLGGNRLHHAIERDSDGRWMLNGEPQHDVTGLIDVDLGFTPRVESACDPPVRSWHRRNDVLSGCLPDLSQTGTGASRTDLSAS